MLIKIQHSLALILLLCFGTSICQSLDEITIPFDSIAPVMLEKGGLPIHRKANQNNKIELHGKEFMETSAFDGVWVGYHDIKAQKKAYKETLVNGELNGEYLDYWPNGTLRTKGYFLNGRRVKKWEWWQENGTSKGFAYYESKDNGLVKFGKRDQEGNKIILGYFLDGIPHGVWAFWYPNGTRRGDVIFLNDHGDRLIIEENTENGTPIIKQGNGIKKANNQDGESIELGEFENGLKVGKWITVHTNGQVASVGKYKNLPVKKEQLFPLTPKNYVLGNPEKEYNTRIYHKKHGKWKYYDNEGTLIRTEKYKNGVRQ